MDAQEQAIRQVVQALYACITFPPGGSPDFDRLHTLFTPGARLIHAQRSGTQIMDLPEFCAQAMAHIEAGRLPSFAEEELHARIDVFGHIAQVRSSYQARGAPGDPTVLTRGVNLIQLLRDGEGWRVLSILWQNEDAEDRIPAEYLTTP